MIRIFRLLHLYLYVFVVALIFYLLYPFFYFHSRKPERYAVLNKFRYYFALLSSGTVGLIYRFRSETKIDWSKTYIICPNHFSNLDISIACLIPRSNFAFMGKDELLKSPIFKLFFKTVDIPVNRESKMSSFRAFK